MASLRKLGPVFLRSAALTLLVLAALVTQTAARAGRRPILLRIEGYFEAAPDGVKPLRTVEVQIGKGASRSLAVSEIVSLGAGPLGATILEEAARYRPSFRLTGERSLLAKLESAPKGRLVKITGNLTSARYVLVSLVDLGPEPAHAPSSDGATSSPTETPH